MDEPIDFDRIDLAWFDKLQNYAYLEKEKPVNDNYFSKIVAVLKTFLNWAKERNYYNGEIHHKFKELPAIQKIDPPHIQSIPFKCSEKSNGYGRSRFLANLCSGIPEKLE
jgi:hypothetical protein